MDILTNMNIDREALPTVTKINLAKNYYSINQGDRVNIS